jgi:dihydrofolate synthase/folylpolyglutamate synthase
MDLLNNFQQAEQFLALHIPKNSQQTFPGELGLKRAKHFLHLLGNPQEKLKIIHVAGTSGKGSTCYLISSLLASQGFKVGLHQSPHLTDVTERFQVDGKIISQKEFVFYLNKIISFIKPSLTYFEILVGLAYLIFYEKKVDYAVIETGLGGKYDGTNVISQFDKLSVLTKIGLDHINILGKTIKEIAFQKAGIINEKSQAISINQDKKAEKIIREVAGKRKANVVFVKRMQSDAIGCNRLGLMGDYQKENASLALAAVNYLSQRDGFEIDKEKVGAVFQTAHFPGRFDIKKIKNKIVIFDGAHNPQKMDAFINSLVKKYPKKKFNFLIAFKKGKDCQEMLKIIVPQADLIVLTSFFTENQDMINTSEDPDKIKSDAIRYNRIKLETKTIPDLKKAWELILSKQEPIVVTGSLYLVGEIFKLIKRK